MRDAGGESDAVKQARARVDAAKRALGERGQPWWDDGAPDWNRRLAKNTPYADWFAEIAEQRQSGGKRRHCGRSISTSPSRIADIE